MSAIQSSKLLAAARTAKSATTLRTRTSQARLSSQWPSSSSNLSLHICAQCQRSYFRLFSSSQRFRSSPKRLLMTKTISAYRTSNLDTSPPPPRNVGVPETSIAGGLKEDIAVNKSSWPGRAPPAPSISHTADSDADANPPLSEQKAQQPQPIAQPPTAESGKILQPTRTLRPAGKSRLRARKAAMTLTPAAVEHLRELLDSPEPKLIRVGVKNKGCSGSAYHLEYVESPGKFDEQVEQDGVKVLIDSKALIKVIGSEMDWVEDKLSARFTFRNPNITEQCGCGESFSVL